jgi:AGCS family alanine or glycine:cation symporter
MERLSEILNTISGYAWGPPMMVLLLGTGIFLTVGLRFMPIRRIGAGFALTYRGRKAAETDEGEITPFQALMTALSATIGTGNIAGVATAIFIGGPGAVFWMWMTALFGMATKYSEGVLAVRFREVDSEGRYVGGPMYYIKNGMGRNMAWLGGLFAFFAMIAGFGIGNMVQANSVAAVLNQNLGVPNIVTGLTLSVLTFAVIIGGLKSIAYVAERLVPAMAVMYVGACLIILGLNILDVPGAFATIVTSAFTPTAQIGGFAGAAVMVGIQAGVARGIFSNEAGLGSAAIAHAAVRTKSPVQQGTVAMLGTFIDTIVVCSMTAIVILTVKVPDPQALSSASTLIPAWQTGLTGAELSAYAFSHGIAGGEWIVTFGLVIFAFTTILGWSYYGERAAEYLLGVWVIVPYRLLWVAALTLGAVFQLSIVWTFSDIMNAFMAVPNLIALLALSGTVFAMTRGALSKEAEVMPPRPSGGE